MSPRTIGGLYSGVLAAVLCGCAPTSPTESGDPADSGTSTPTLQQLADDAVLAQRSVWNAADDAGRRRVVTQLSEALPEFSFVRMDRFEWGGFPNHVGVFEHRTLKLEFVLVPGGEFLMGSRSDGAARMPDETPHVVAVSPFLMCRIEVPVGVWREHASEGPYGDFLDDERYPAIAEGWGSAVAFARSLGLCLPTEAEWEYAARAGSNSSFGFGDDASSMAEFAWFRGNAEGTPRPVAEKRPNGFGLFDMQGNVAEWCIDAYGEVTESVPLFDYRHGRRQDPVQRGIDPLGFTYMVMRGGNCDSDTGDLRLAARGAYPANMMRGGVRLVRRLLPLKRFEDGDGRPR